MSWVLLLLVVGQGMSPASFTVPSFKTLESCMAAGQKAQKDLLLFQGHTVTRFSCLEVGR